MKDKYIISIITLSILLAVSIFIIIYLVIIANDLKDNVINHENSLGVCKVDLEKSQIENDEIRESCSKE